jgi:hypothetical protein
VGGPVFAENLQALTISFAIITPPLSKRHIAIGHSHGTHSCKKLLQKSAIVNRKIARNVRSPSERASRPMTTL